jgi:hypothetical protein
MPISWKRSREAHLWRRLDPAQATRVMVGAYGEGAGVEVLLRAFLEERDTNPPAVRFWLRVYQKLRKNRIGSVPGSDPKEATRQRPAVGLVTALQQGTAPIN